MGKGDARRPSQVSDYDARWERTFKQIKSRDGRDQHGEPAAPLYEWAVYFRHAGEAEQLGGEFERRETALNFAERLTENGAATRVERIA